MSEEINVGVEKKLMTYSGLLKLEEELKELVKASDLERARTAGLSCTGKTAAAPSSSFVPVTKSAWAFTLSGALPIATE